MTIFTRTALATALALGLAAPAMAQFSNVYFFGDSVSDSGNYKSVLPAGTGLFTTNPGPVWSQLFAQNFGFSAVPSTQPGGNNYAYGGARVTLLPGYVGNPLSPMAARAGRDAGSAVSRQRSRRWQCALLGPGRRQRFLHPVRTAAGGRPQRRRRCRLTLTTAAVQLGQQAAMLADCRRSIHHGVDRARHGNDPDRRRNRTGRDAHRALQFVQHDAQLDAVTRSACRRSASTRFALQNEILKNPAAFGFANATGIACTVPPADTIALCNPSTLVSPIAHRVRTSLRRCAPDHRGPQDPRRTTRTRSSSRRSRSACWPRRRSPPSRPTGARSTAGCCRAPMRCGPAGKFEAWAAYDYSNPDLDSGFRSGDATLNTLVVGGDIKLSEHLLAGASAGFTENKGDFGGGGYKLSQTTGTVYVGYGEGPWYAGATLGGGDLDYERRPPQHHAGRADRAPRPAAPGGYTVTGRLLGRLLVHLRRLAARPDRQVHLPATTSSAPTRSRARPAPR